MKPLTTEMKQKRLDLLSRARQLTLDDDIAAKIAVEKLEAFLHDKSELVMQLYRLTGTIDDIVAAIGFGSLYDDVAQLMATADGRNYVRTPPGKPLSIDEVNAKLIRQLVGDEKAMAAHAELMQLDSELKAHVSKALAGESAKKNAEFADCLNTLLLAESESLDWVRADKFQNVEFTADPSAPEQEFYDDIAIVDDQLSNVVKDGRMKWNHTATAGRPNDEPILHWAAQKRAKMMMRYAEMNKKLSAVTFNYILYFDENRATALERWLPDFQKQFAEKPKFLDQCVYELAEVYQREGRMIESTLFRNAIGAASTLDRELSGDLPVPQGTVYIHIAEKCTLDATQFWMTVWAEADASGVDYQGFSSEGYQHVKGYSDEFTTIRVQSADQAKLEEMVFRWLAKMTKDNPAFNADSGPILIDRGGKLSVWPD